MRTAVLVLLLLGSCGPEVRRTPTNPGLRTRLIAVSKEFVVGGPLEFRLELTNESPWAMIYDDQGVETRGLDVLSGPDGKPVPDIDIPRQTSGHDRLLRPGETVVLFESFDVAPYYLIARPGRYQVQFTGHGLAIIDAREVPLLALLATGKEPTTDVGDQWFEEIDKLHESYIWVPSNVVTLDLKPGRPPDAALLADRLLKILPEGWSLGVDDLAEAGEVRILLQRLFSLKSETATVQVVVTGRTLKNLGERVCSWSDRNVYVSAEPKAAKLWPDFRAKVAEALRP